MIEYEETTTVTKSPKKNEMPISVLDHNQSHKKKCQDSTSTEHLLRKKLAKLSVNMKNYCSIHMRLLHSLHRNGLQDLILLNPEYQIKILEENLNCLSKKGSPCNSFQIKSNLFSNHCTFETTDTANVSSGSVKYFDSTGHLKTATDASQFTFRLNGSYSDSKLSNEGLNYKTTHLIPQNGLFRKYSFPSIPIAKIKEKYSSKKKRNSALLLNSNCVSSDSELYANGSRTMSSDISKKKIDVDNQFEFTVEQEKIVSFVCSPTPPRRNKIVVDPGQKNLICDSDPESDKQSELSSSKGDSVSETVSNLSYKSSNTISVQTKETFPGWDQIPKINKILWHPPSSQKRVETPLVNKQPIYNCSASARFVQKNPPEGMVNHHDFLNSYGALYGRKRLRSSFDQETILFREASLRGCYNLENILKDIKPHPHTVEKEVREVREAIFSAIRLRRSHENVVTDSILSVLHICKSWIKLNSHFEHEELKEIFDEHGVDLSIISDFSQWQCISRIFIDKMVNTLQKLVYEKNNVSNLNNNPCSTSNFGTMSSPCFSNHGNYVNMSMNCDSGSYGVFCETQNMNPNSEMIQGKHWRQRRFFPDQGGPETVDAGAKRCKSKMTLCTSYQGFQLPFNYNMETSFGQGDSGVMSSQKDFHCNKFNHSFVNKNANLVQSNPNFFSNQLSFPSPSAAPSGFFDKNLTNFRCLNDLSGIREDKNVVTLVQPNDLSNSDNQYAISQQSFPTIPPVYDNNFGLVSHYQPNSTQSLVKPNPIHCMDTDISDNCMKSSYMKPGSYNPPQKPAGFQKVINNNIPIEDTPVVGIPFLYSSSQNQQRPRSPLESPSNTSQQQIPLGNCEVNKSDDTWKTALSLAESFRDSMIAKKTDDSPNLKISETVSLKSHFLLSDDTSQHSSSNDIKFDSETDEISPPEFSHPKPPTKISEAEVQFKTTDWLNKSFNEEDLDIKKDILTNSETRSDQESRSVSESKEESNQQFKIKQKKSVSPNISKCVENSCTFEDKNSISAEYGRSTTPKKPKKPKKVREDLISAFPQRPSILYRKPKSIFKRSVTKQVSCKLEDILNCIWNTEISTLVEEELNTDKEIARLEVKIKCPLYLQNMRCKLTNQSYDTLEQALVDFQQYFADIKNRNKGDKQCVEAADALEQMFFGMVEKHFGLLYQPSPQYFGPVGVAPGSKPRRPKKTPRRC